MQEYTDEGGPGQAYGAMCQHHLHRAARAAVSGLSSWRRWRVTLAYGLLLVGHILMAAGYGIHLTYMLMHH
jgi:hypothetical protein